MHQKCLQILVNSIIAIWLVFTPAIFADEIELAIGLTTHHVDNEPHLNNDNEFIAIRYNDYTAGTFVNSHYIRSYMVGKRWKTVDLYNFGDTQIRGNVDYGIVYGYKDTPVFNFGGFTPAVYGSLDTIHNATDDIIIGFKIGYVPSAGGGVFNTFFTITRNF